MSLAKDANVVVCDRGYLRHQKLWRRRVALRLNNKYFLGGRDPSSFANVAWCFGLHDRPWKERAVFGKVRYMNAAGLERKFDMEAYVRAVDRLIEEEGVGGPRE